MQNLLNRTIPFIIILSLLTGNLRAEDDGQNQPDSINKKRLSVFIISASAAYAVSLIALNEAWYKDYPRESFHFFDDNTEWKQLDKAGHFYSAYQISHASARAFLWSGFSAKKAYFWGSVTGFMVMNSIEILDGFSSEYGASWGDVVANSTGSLFLVGQYWLWKENRIHPKFSFHRTSYPEIRPDVLGDGWQEEFLKDYNGQTYWLSFDIYKFLPKQSRFPKWLNFAFGYGAHNMVYANDENNQSFGYDSYRQYYFGIDFDLTHIKSKSKAVNTLLYLVNMIKLPAPALEYNRSEGVKFHYLYF